MFVPIVPIVPHTTVINKTIVYSDTVLPLKDIGNNLKVTCIKDVSEVSLESCLRTIFEANHNVIFNTIQYSKNEEKVYFYTNKEISVKEYEESKYFKYKPISSHIELLDEVKRLLTSDKIENSDCISLYDVANLVSQMNHKYQIMKDNYYSILKERVKSKFGNSTDVVIYMFDYIHKELRIGFKRFFDYDEIVFSKNDGDLYILKSESYSDTKFFTETCDILSKLYDEFMKFSDYEMEKSYNVNSVNSSFLVDISSYGIDIFTKSPTNRYMKDFQLTFSNFSRDDIFNYDCNSATVINTLKGNEYNIFKKIFVKISDCPKWSQVILYKLRQEQLAEEQKIEKKKQRRLELVRKFFPFLKK